MQLKLGDQVIYTAAYIRSQTDDDPTSDFWYMYGEVLQIHHNSVLVRWMSDSRPVETRWCRKGSLARAGKNKFSSVSKEVLQDEGIS